QRQPMISHDPSGGFAVAWGSYTQDGSSYGVFARRFPRPTVVLDDDVVIEGQAGSTSATFLIQLSEPPDPDPLELNYSTADGTAVAGSDYTSSSGMLSIPPGQTLGFVTAPVLGDTLYEADEFFLMNLSSSGMANIPDPTAVGAIFNDDDPPSLAIGDVQIVEGNSGTSMAEFTVSISEASGLPAQVDFMTFDGTASAGKDYTAASGTLIFPAMSTAAQTASVSIDGDLQFEPDETFFVQLSQPADATIGDDLGIGTILNDDGNFLITTGPAAGGGGLIRRYEGD
ncbi:MAG TPA: Calx-beta domain-containing protein, partial [Acidobacteriota bacterium]